MLTIATLGACAGSHASVMPMRQIPLDQQARDRRECEAQAGHADVGKPVQHAAIGTITGTLAGVALSVVLFFSGGQSANDSGQLAAYFGISAALGAAVGLVAGTAMGFSSGVRVAHDEYFTRYTDCMRERGYAVFRERRDAR